MKSTKARSEQEFHQYEKGLNRKLWKYLRFAGLQEKKFRQKYVKLPNRRGVRDPYPGPWLTAHRAWPDIGDVHQR